MGDLGLQGAFGLAGLQAALRQRASDQMAQRQHEQEMQINDRKMALAEQDAQQRALEHSMMLDEHKASLAEQAQTHQQGIADREMTQTEKINESTPAGFLPQDSPIAGRLSMIGAAVPQEARPAIDEGPLQPGDSGAEKLQGFLKMATSRQQDAAAGQEAKRAALQQQGETAANALQDRADARTQAQQNHQDNLRLTASLRPPADDKLTKVEHKDPATGRTVIEYLPQSAIRGQTFQKGATGATETRLASAQAVNQTGADIIAQVSDPAVAKSLGVAMGRYSKLQDFLGDPPPEFSQLAGSIESYALANMGVHGMRSAQGAAQIKKLLDQPHTPESLIAAIKGLSGFSQHFMANEGRSATKPTAADLIKKYGGQ